MASHPSLRSRKIYRKRLKNSSCRRKGPAVCRSMTSCKYVSTRKRNYCRMKNTRNRLARVMGKGRKTRRR